MTVEDPLLFWKYSAERALLEAKACEGAPGAALHAVKKTKHEGGD